MSNNMEGKRRPAGERNSNMTCRATIGYGENVIEGKFGFKDVISGKKRAPFSTELTTGVIISAANGGNPNRQVESR